MNITHFADLLLAAAQQAEPQRLLFVFTRAELPDRYSEAQKAQFLKQQGGALAPVMCVDKLPSELTDFTSLVSESEKTGQAWDIVFASSLSGQAGHAPTSEAAESALHKMIESIKFGGVGAFLAFDRAGELVVFH